MHWTDDRTGEVEMAEYEWDRTEAGAETERESGAEFAAARPEGDAANDENTANETGAADTTVTDRLRGAAVGLANLSGLGLGYALMRRWRVAAVCWVATGVLLLITPPADADGVPGGVLVLYLIVLVVAAVHGALRGLRTPLTWPRRSRVAAALAFVLLAAPGGGIVLYNDAHAEAVQQMLLRRLDEAGRIMAAAKGEPFSTADPHYEAALATTAICWTTTAIRGPESWCRVGWPRSTRPSPLRTRSRTTARRSRR